MTSRRRNLALGVALAVCVLLTGVAAVAARSGGGQVDVAAGSAAPPDGTVDPASVGNTDVHSPWALPGGVPAPAIVAALPLRTLDGAATTIGDLRGSRGTVIAFWASYCIPCRTELPLLQGRAPGLRRQGVAVVLADFGESSGAARGFLADHGVTLPAHIDPGGSTHDALRLVGVPSTAVLDAGGAVAARVIGFPDSAELDAALASLGVSP